MERVTGPLSECEALLGQIAGEPNGALGRACLQTLEAGGKRLRPLLVFLCAREDPGFSEGLLAAATAVELVHMASLVHDDVLDGAELRRGRPTIAAGFGLDASTAAGDYLFSSAFKVLAATGSPRAISMLSSSSLGLSQGEFAQMEQVRDRHLSIESYIDRCQLKTAGLFTTSCALGSILSGCSEKTISAVSEFGRCLGLAFQIADDILDFAGDSEELGKTAGADLRDGTFTLPLIIALKTDPSLDRLLAEPPDDATVAEICQRLKSTGALSAASQEALRYVKLAQEAVEPAASQIDTGPLRLIAEMAVERKV